MFGLMSIDNVQIKYSRQPTSKDDVISGGHATAIVETVGMILFAVYHVGIIIVLVNMLIAMMSHSFEAIQVFRSI